MNRLLTIGLLLLLCACKKEERPNDTVVQFSVNGSAKSLNGAQGNYCEESYFTGLPNSYSFVFQSSGQSVIFTMGADFAPYEFTSTDGAQLDSLVVGETYDQFYGGQRNDLIINNQIFRSISTWHLYVTIASITPWTIDGSFTGLVVGVDSASGAPVTDTITEGVFRNIPVVRYYQ
jgi:hypothetical protein